MNDATINGSITFRDHNGNNVEVVEEIKALRASVDLLVRLSNVAVGNVNLGGLKALQPHWFERIFADFGEGWNVGGGTASIGSEVKHYNTNITARLPWALTNADDQWAFVNAVKLAIATHHVPSYKTVEEVIRVVIRGLPEHVDPVTRLAALKSVCPEPSDSSDARGSASPAPHLQSV